MATCTKCGTAILGGAKFCAACGTPVAAAPPSARPPLPPPPSVRPPPPPPPPPPPRPVDPFGATAAVSPARPSSYGPPPIAQAGYAPAPQNPYAPPTPPPITSQPQAPSFGQVSPLAASFAGVPVAPPPPSWSAQPQMPASPYGGAAQPFPPQQGYGTPPPQPGQPPPLPYPNPPPQYGSAPAPAYGGMPQPVAQQPAAPPPAQAPWGQASPVAFGVGARVLVQWADGNRYPATVTQSAPGQCLVAFPDGRQQWVEVQYLSSGI